MTDVHAGLNLVKPRLWDDHRESGLAQPGITKKSLLFCPPALRKSDLDLRQGVMNIYKYFRTPSASVFSWREELSPGHVAGAFFYETRLFHWNADVVPLCCRKPAERARRDADC